MATDALEAGVAYLAILASGKDLQRSTDRAVKKVKAPDIVAKIDGQIGDLEKKVKAAKERLDELKRSGPDPKARLDVGELMRKAAEAKARLEELNKAGPDPQVGLDIKVLQARARVVNDKLAELRRQDPTPEVGLQIAKFQAEANRVKSRLAELQSIQATAHVQARVDGQAEVDRLEAEIDRVAGAHDAARLRAEVQGEQEVRDLEAQITRLRGQRAQVQVDADTARASAQMRFFAAQVAEVNGKRADVHVGASGVGDTAAKLIGLAAAAGAAAGALPAVATAAAAASGGLGTLGQAALTVVAGFSGVGDALSASEADQKSAATSAASNASAQTSAARQVASAASSLQQAQSQQARTAIQGSQSVASAARSLAAAQTAADRASITGAEQVASARRALAAAQIAAARAVEDAQRSYIRSLQAERYAQEDLTRARKDAQRAFEDLQLATSGAGLSQERATLNLERARQALSDAQASGMSGIDLQEKDLDVREAAQSLAEAQKRYKDLRSDSAEWARTGVDGSDQVRSALRSLQAAQESVGDSARQVSRAQVDGARSVQDAQIALAQATEQAGWAQQDAARGVADAQLALAAAQQSAQWANADAADQVAQAQRALADAYAAAGQAGAAGANQSAYALSQLTPAGREFVRFMTGEWQPAIERVSHASADELLPRVETAMRNLLGLEPLVNTAVRDTAGIVGDLAVRGSQLATSAPFQADFATILSANANQLQSYGDAGLNMFGILTDLAAVASPYAEHFARVVDYGSQAAESWIIGARASGELDTVLRNGESTLDFLVDRLTQIAGGLWDTARGFVPLGGAALVALGDLTQFIGNLASWNPTLTSVVAGLGLGAIGLGKFAAAVSLANTTGWIAGLRTSAGVLATLFNPAALYSSTALSKVRDGFTAAGAMAGGFTRNATGSAAAAERVDRAVGGAGRVLSGLGASLPLIGAVILGLSAAWDAQNTSVDEAMQAWSKGGLAAEQAAQKVKQQTDEFNQQEAGMPDWARAADEWINKNILGKATTEDFNKSNDERRAKMTTLQRAQEDLTRAQGDYELALSRNPPQSDAVVSAHDRLIAANQRVDQEQDNARRATMSATDALRDQQDTILAGINSRLQHEAAVRSTARAQQEYDRVLRETPNDTLAVQDALGNLEQAQTRQAEAARKAAQDLAKGKPGMDAAAEGNRAYAQSIGDMVAKTQGQLSPALADMVQSLDAGQLAAAGARVEIDKAGNAVAVFPNGKTVVLNADISPAAQRAAQLRDQINAMVGSIRVDANGQPADDASRALMDRINATIAQMKIDGDPGPGDGSLFALAQRIRATSAAMGVGGDTVPAQNDTEGLKAYVARQWAKINDAANTDPARLDTLNRMGWVNNQWAGINVNAKTDQVGRDIQAMMQRTLGMTPWNPITVYLQPYMQPVRAPGDFSPRRAGGGLLTGYAGGGTIDGYATGGRTRRPPGATRPHGRDDTLFLGQRDEFVTNKLATRLVGLDGMAAINGITTARDGAAARAAILAALSGAGVIENSTRIAGMADGTTGARGYATGGALVAPSTPTLTPHSYDTASSVVAAKPLAVEMQTVGARGGGRSGLTVNQTFTDSSVTARDGFDAANRESWLVDYGGVHG